MTHHTSHHRLAGVAIAALLAAGPTSFAFAQDATVAPPPVTVAPPPPTIVLPSADPAPVAVPSPVTAEPVASPSAAAPAATPSAAPRTEPRPATTTRSAARSAPPAQSATPTTNNTAATAVEPSAPPPAETAPADPVPVAEAAPAPVAAPADEGGDNTLALAGLLGIVALGGAGIYAATRRRRAVYEEPASQEAAYEPTAAVASPPARLSQPGVMPMARTAEPLVVGTPEMVAEPEVRRPAAASFAMPGTVPSDPDARRELLERMVAAAPNDENPFTSRKARLRRARLILQHRESQGIETPSPRTTLDRTQPFGTRTLVDA